jgi:hypothetical protein
MEMIRGVIGGELEFAAIELELGIADATCNATDERSKIGMRAKVVLEIVESENDIGHGLVRARETNSADNAAVISEFAREATSI